MSDDYRRRIWLEQNAIRSSTLGQVSVFENVLRLQNAFDAVSRHRDAALFGSDHRLLGVYHEFQDALDRCKRTSVDSVVNQIAMGGRFSDIASSVSHAFGVCSSDIRNHTDYLFDRVRGHLDTPWTKVIAELHAAEGLARLQNLETTLSLGSGFSENAVDTLRAALGDWRGPLELKDSTLLNYEKRHAYYNARGFDPNLSYAPQADVFHVVSLLDLDQELDCGGSPIGDEQEFVITNKAHDIIMRFEYKLRVFIVKSLDSVDSNWMNTRLPSGMLDRWKEKQVHAAKQGQKNVPLIQYADFTDYVQIITRKDNWRDIFGSVFLRSTSVQESFQRLYPVRICTMHARPLSQDDYLFMVVEVKRLQNAFNHEGDAR